MERNINNVKGRFTKRFFFLSGRKYMRCEMNLVQKTILFDYTKEILQKAFHEMQCFQRYSLLHMLQWDIS